MYLNRAEANVKLGNITNAMADVNTIRERAIVGGSYTSAQFTAATAKTLVDKERQLELALRQSAATMCSGMATPLHVVSLVLISQWLTFQQPTTV